MQGMNEMLVKMTTEVSGGRGDGTLWPKIGQILDCDSEEGLALCHAGMAIPVVSSQETRVAVVPDELVEKRADGEKEVPPPAKKGPSRPVARPRKPVVKDSK
jgi:hypothetical protein